ncbi:MAG: AMP-binding protein, partial [Bdellovibrio sp.]
KLYSPKNIAIKDGETQREVSYAEFFELANRGAHLLGGEFGIRKGDRVAVLATNELEYVFLFFALQRLGAILVPVNFRLTPREVEHIISDSSPKLILFQEPYRKAIENLSGENKPAKLLLHGENSFASKLANSPAEEYPFKSQENDPVMILYTSGTTGAPKGAILTYKMLFWNSINTTLRLNISQQDCTVIFLPFFHTGGWNVLTTPFIHRGAKVVFLKKFDADQILTLSEQEKATIMFGVPTTMDMMARSP